jgi:hypothetical protein
MRNLLGLALVLFLSFWAWLWRVRYALVAGAGVALLVRGANMLVPSSRAVTMVVLGYALLQFGLTFWYRERGK